METPYNSFTNINRYYSKEYTIPLSAYGEVFEENLSNFTGKNLNYFSVTNIIKDVKGVAKEIGIGKKDVVKGVLPPDFNASVYARLNPDVVAAGWDPTEHYLQFGYKEGRQYKENIFEQASNSINSAAQGVTTIAKDAAEKTKQIIIIGGGVLALVIIVILLMKKK